MDSKLFCYWLRGLLEVGDPKTLNEKQIQIIKDHLDLVFTKVTPDRVIEPIVLPLPPRDRNSGMSPFESPIQVYCHKSSTNDLLC